MNNKRVLWVALFSSALLVVSSMILKLDFYGGNALTGADTSGTGIINFTYAGTVAITVSGTIDFGSGYINASIGTANISSETTWNSSTGWINTTGAWVAGTNLTINNTGSVVVNITFQNNQSVNAWIGGNSSADSRAKFVDNEAGSCTGAYPTNYSVQPNATVQNVCTSTTQGQALAFGNDADTIAMYIRVFLTQGGATGQRSTTLTFSATQNQ